MDGGTLREHTRPDSLLPVESVLEILYKVCKALEYALTHRLLHRDIKPANIMLTADGFVARIGDLLNGSAASDSQVMAVGRRQLPVKMPSGDRCFR